MKCCVSCLVLFFNNWERFVVLLVLYVSVDHFLFVCVCVLFCFVLYWARRAQVTRKRF